VQQVFVMAVVCPRCGHRRNVSLRLLGRLSTSQQTCPECGARMRAAGADAMEWLAETDLPADVRHASLRHLGLRRGDVVTVAGAERAAHFQLGGIA
jgi:DNA-directed RNA polymerase subunit RPC12/RpoP